MSQMIAERAQQKSLARARDEERLRAGEISASDLQRENLQFRRVRRDRIGFIRAGKGKQMRFLSA